MPNEAIESLNVESLRQAELNNTIRRLRFSDIDETIHDIDVEVLDKVAPEAITHEVPAGEIINDTLNVDDNVQDATVDPSGVVDVVDVVDDTEIVDGVDASNDANDMDCMVMHISMKKGLRMYEQLAQDALRKEVTQMVEKGVFLPVHKNTAYNDGKKIIRSSVFFKEKCDSEAQG